MEYQTTLMADITTLKLPFMVMKLLSPTKILLVFETEKDAEEAWDLSSLL